MSPFFSRNRSIHTIIYDLQIWIPIVQRKCLESYPVNSLFYLIFIEQFSRNIVAQNINLNDTQRGLQTSEKSISYSHISRYECMAA